MLRLVAAQAETLWDEALPVEVRQLPEDLAALDELLCDPVLLAPITAHWRREVQQTGRALLSDGRPTIAIETYVRLMVLKHRYGWGYRTLMGEVSDSIHLRRFCRIALSERVPDESTVRKLTRRIGAETVDEVTRALISKATREQRFRARAVRIDSTVIEADVKYPTDAGLAAHGVRALAAEGRKVAAKVGQTKTRVRDRSRSMGKRLRAISRTIRRRSGEAKAEVLALTEQTGDLLSRSVREARRLAAAARAKARGRGAKAKLRAAAKLDELADRCEKVAAQITQRVAGKPISDRLISLSDPDARPIRKGKLGKPNEFGYVAQIAEVTPNTKRGARGLILPAASLPGNPTENALLPETVEELTGLGLAVREVALDGGFAVGPTTQQLSDLAPERVFISGRQQPGSRRTQRRMQRYRTGAEGRISHLKRGYALRRSRLKGHDGQQTSTGWGILAYNLDTLAIRTG
ncbi:MAG: transposase [Actinobacteria bacterium]|nr:transposase [Actinomycetota bacterium]MCA1698614.1 transposase [Actinomycetota bacterium]